MTAPVLQIPSSGAGESPLTRLNRRYFERFQTDDLISVRERLLSVLDERSRQGSLFAEPVALPLFEAPRPAAPVVVVAAPVAVPAPMPVIDVAADLSPSQLNTFVGDCQVKWFYRSVLKLTDPMDVNRALGSAVHMALAEQFRQKLETREDLPVEGVRAIFRDVLTDRLDESLLTAEDNTDALRDCGEALVSLYMERVAPSIDPAAVEMPVEGAIGGVHVRGYVDLMTTDGQVIDLKTASKKPSGLRADYRRQLTTYVMLAPNASGVARLDTLTKTKTVALHQQTLDVGPCDRAEVERLYPLAQEAMRAGLYMPNRGSYLCSRKYCAFADRCCDEYGGEV